MTIKLKYLTAIAAALFMTSSFSMASAPQGDEAEVLNSRVVRLDTPTGSILTMTVNDSTTIEDMKEYIEENRGYAVNTQRLFINGRVMGNDELLPPLDLKKATKGVLFIRK